MIKIMIKKYIKLVLLASHFGFLCLGLGVGFGIGIYTLPLLIADRDVDSSEIQEMKDTFIYKGTFRKNQKDNDFFHWAEGNLYVSNKEIAFEGSIAPGPDYKVYLIKGYVEGIDAFLKIKKDAVYVDDLKNFGNFKKELPKGININDYNTVVIWCERFEKFIGSAQYNNS